MNSNLLYLSSDDFVLINQQNSPDTILCHDISGFSLLLFYSTQCVYCHKLMPIFKRLPETIQGCQFGIINVSTNRKVIEMARNSITPIKYVPLIILYYQGKPYMRYDGPSDINEIKRFIIEVSNSIQQQTETAQTTSQNNNAGTAMQTSFKKEIPAYTIGNPLCGEDGVCYLEFDDAYQK